MKAVQFSSIFVFLFLGCSLWAQDSTAILLREVEVSDHLLKDFSKTQNITTLSDSIIKRNSSFLTSLLNYNSLIYFKENGLGGASSPSFRGTTASQTAVVWNGININSQLLGQTDFNTINSLGFNSIIVKPGGGSVLYGSGAIGGSIHLNTDLYYYKKFENEVFLKYGSFNTFEGRFQSKLASEKYSLQIGFSQTSSDNDYKWLKKNRRNLNGEFQNYSLSTNFGYKINQKNTIKFFSNVFDGERHFSLVLPTEIPTKYTNYNLRNLLEWQVDFNKFTSRLKVAHLHEAYKYFPNVNNDFYTFGKVETFLVKQDLAYAISDKMKLNSVFDFTQNKGDGSDILDKKRQIGSASLLFSHLIGSNFLYEITARKEITDNYESPFLFSIGTKLNATDFYTLKLNASKSFRIPTFNDLYWLGSGNTDLKPETSHQAELINELNFKNFGFSVTGFYNSVEDMLRWIPSGSVWRPQNTDEVESFGFETRFIYTKSIGDHQFQINGNYGYTSSRDKRLDKYLIYVPNHKANAHISYSKNQLGIYADYLFVGEVYTRSDNTSRYNLDAYQVYNLGADYTFKSNYMLGIKVQNLLNTYYESVENRPLPGRNFMMYLNIKF